MPNLTELLTYLVIVVLVVAVVVQTIVNYRTTTKATDNAHRAAETANKIVSDLMSSPLFLTLAQGATAGIPQAVFDKAYSKADTLEDLLGKSSTISLLIQRVEDLAKAFDHDQRTTRRRKVTRWQLAVPKF